MVVCSKKKKNSASFFASAKCVPDFASSTIAVLSSSVPFFGHRNMVSLLIELYEQRGGVVVGAPSSHTVDLGSVSSSSHTKTFRNVCTASLLDAQHEKCSLEKKSAIAC